MTVGLQIFRFAALLFLPLAALVVPTLIVRPLLPPGLTTAWPMFALVLTVASLAVFATTTSRWTQSRTAAALVTMASVGATLVGFFVLLLWALTSTE